MLSQVFGKMLFYPESECLKEFPSPEELKHRIIISTKPPKEYLEAQNLKGGDPLKRKDSEDDVWGREPSCLMADQEDEDKVGRKWMVSSFFLFSRYGIQKTHIHMILFFDFYLM